MFFFKFSYKMFFVGVALGYIGVALFMVGVAPTTPFICKVTHVHIIPEGNSVTVIGEII